MHACAWFTTIGTAAPGHVYASTIAMYIYADLAHDITLHCA